MVLLPNKVVPPLDVTDSSSRIHSRRLELIEVAICVFAGENDASCLHTSLLCLVSHHAILLSMLIYQHLCPSQSHLPPQFLAKWLRHHPVAAPKPHNSLRRQFLLNKPIPVIPECPSLPNPAILIPFLISNLLFPWLPPLPSYGDRSLSCEQRRRDLSDPGD